VDIACKAVNYKVTYKLSAQYMKLVCTVDPGGETNKTINDRNMSLLGGNNNKKLQIQTATPCHKYIFTKLEFV
jgi:hypothetical protein